MSRETHNRRTFYNLVDRQHTRWEEAENFIRELRALGLKYGLALEHEDDHGSFIVCRRHKWNHDWWDIETCNTRDYGNGVITDE